MQNREEWVAKGQAITAEMRQKMERGKCRQGQSLKTMSLLHGPSDYSKAGGSSFSNFGNLSLSQIAANDLPESPRRSSLQHAHSNRSLNVTRVSSRRNMFGSVDSSRSLDTGTETASQRPGLQAAESGLSFGVDSEIGDSRRHILSSSSHRSIGLGSKRQLLDPSGSHRSLGTGSRRQLLTRSGSGRSAAVGTLTAPSSRRNLLKSSSSDHSLRLNNGDLTSVKSTPRGILKNSNSNQSLSKGSSHHSPKNPSDSSPLLSPLPPPDMPIREMLKLQLDGPPLASGKKQISPSNHFREKLLSTSCTG